MNITALGDVLLLMEVLRMMIERYIYRKGIFKMINYKDMVDLYTAMEVTLKVFTWIIRDQKVYIILIMESKNAHSKMAKDTG